MVEDWLISVGALALTLWPLGAAQAQPATSAPNPAVVELYTQAWEARSAGRWDEACAKFNAALAIEITPTIVVNVGDCHARAGKVATALGEYERARMLNRATADPERRTAIEGEIDSRVLQVRPRIPKVRIEVAPRVAGLAVKLDGKEVSIRTLGVDLALDPGTHEVTVTAAGHRPERRALVVKEGTTVPVVISLVAEAVAEAPPKVSHVGSITLGATAVVLAGVGAGLSASVLSRHGQLAETCAEGVTACKDEADAQETQATIANVLFGVAGAAAVGAGVFLFVVEWPDGKKAEVGFSLHGASVRGVW